MANQASTTAPDKQRTASTAVRGRDLLALLQKLRQRGEDASEALPALIAAAERATASLIGGEHRQRRAGSGENFWQFREYQPTDRPQDIDWRQTAKGERVFVRQKEWQTAQTVLFWAQNDAGMHFRSSINLPSKFESAVTLCLGLGMMLTKSGEQIGPLDGSVRVGRGEQGVQSLGLALLAEKSRVSEHALPHPDTVTANASIILCGDFLGDPDELDRNLTAIAGQQRHGVLVQVLDNAERTLPWIGRVIFTGMGDDALETIENVDSIREEYRTRLDNHLDAVRRVARRHGFEWVMHDTSLPASTALAQIWGALSPHGDTERMA